MVASMLQSRIPVPRPPVLDGDQVVVPVPDEVVVELVLAVAQHPALRLAMSRAQSPSSDQAMRRQCLMQVLDHPAVQALGARLPVGQISALLAAGSEGKVSDV